MTAVRLALYMVLGLLLSITGVGVITNPIGYFSIVACVVAIDILP